MKIGKFPLVWTYLISQYNHMDLNDPRLKKFLVIILTVLVVVLATTLIMINKKKAPVSLPETSNGNQSVGQKVYSSKEIEDAVNNQPQSAESPATQKEYTPEEIDNAIKKQPQSAEAPSTQKVYTSDEVQAVINAQNK
jgi:hypothetical protein